MEDLSVLKKYGFFFKKQLGQNFLTDGNLLRAIVVRDAGVSRGATVLEIGAGAGTLTRILSENAGRVISYEIDKSLQSVLSETLSGCENVEVVFRDFLKEPLGPLEKSIGPYLVVANLPYYLTTPLVMRFVEESKLCQSLTVMVQEEVARRFCAMEASSDYGAVTAAIARRGSCEITRKVPRELFTPRPNVDSAVVKIDFQRGGFLVKSEKAFRETVRCAFLNRRKTLENNLMSGFRLTRESAKQILAAAQVEAGARGETLSPERLGALSDLLYERGMIK